MIGIYAAQLSLTTSVYQNLLDIVKAFDAQDKYITKYEDMNILYKEGIDILTEESDSLAVYHGAKSPSDQFILRGPFGLGVALGQHKEGTIVCVSYGIAIGLFIDIATYILRKNVFRAGKVFKKFYKLFGNEDLDQLEDGHFKLILIAIYESAEFAIGNEICKAADRIARNFVFDNFEYHEAIGIENAEIICTEKIQSITPRVVCAGPKKIIEMVQKITSIVGNKGSNLMCF